MRILFWVKRFFLIAIPAFVLLSAVYLARGRATPVALREAALWAFISASIFVGARIYHLSRGRECALCNDGVNSTTTPA